MFQNYALFPTKTVWNNIYSCIFKKSKEERRTITADIIKKFQLQGTETLYPRQISGGQQQRTALARILVSEPQIIMLDEPFSALDTHLKWQMEQEISAVLAEFSGTTVFVSHNRDEVYRISDKIAVMSSGKIDLIGTKADVFDAPKTVTAALMTGCKNISKAEKVDDYHVRATDWGIVLKTDSVVTENIKYVGIRAHHLKREGAENNYPCKIHKIIDEPFETILIFSFTSENGDSAEHLQFQVSKDIIGAEIDMQNLNDLTLHIPANKIMCLEG
jgi:molybdate transport system ATP-binding protein